MISKVRSPNSRTPSLTSGLCHRCLMRSITRTKHYQRSTRTPGRQGGDQKPVDVNFKGDVTIIKDRPLRYVEMFTATMNLTTVARETGWESVNPITIETGFNLRQPEGIKAAWAVLREFEPDFVTSAFPCTPWSTLQNLHLKIEGYSERLARKREEDKPFLDFAAEVCRWQSERGALWEVEQPAQASSWDQPQLLGSLQLPFAGDVVMERNVVPLSLAR